MTRYLFITCFVVLFDQISKFYVKSMLDYNFDVDIIGSLLKFKYIENSGIIFGIQVNNILYYLVIIVSVLIIVYIYHLMKTLVSQKNASIGLIALALIMGGAIGNIADRLFVVFDLFHYEGVVDFISIGIGEDFRFPYIFNIADTSVTIGISLFMYYNYIQNKMLHNGEAKEI
tara:strand:+ start:590 stop:1108 length:519 start_codon:yes stop_codon:yes gene_type:complete